MVLCLQGGNARIGSSGSLFREEKDGEFFMLIEDKTGNTLTVRDFSTAPDTPIIALRQHRSDSQKWKRFTPIQFVSISYITLFHVLESNTFSIIKCQHCKPNLKHTYWSEQK